MYTVAFNVMACGFVLGEYLILNLMAVKASWTGSSTSFQFGCFTCGAESTHHKRDPCGFNVSSSNFFSRYSKATLPTLILQH